MQIERSDSLVRESGEERRSMYYRVHLRDLPNGSVEATCPDIPAFFTVQPSKSEALRFVRENLAVTLQGAYRKRHLPVPVSRPRKDEAAVPLPVRVQAKIILWNYMLRNRWRIADLAKELAITQSQAQRLVDFDRDLASMESIEEAFMAIGGSFSLEEKNPGTR